MERFWVPFFAIVRFGRDLEPEREESLVISKSA